MSVNWRVSVPPMLLAVVASTQIALARTAHLTPWKGGGFGMFSSLDAVAFRRVRVFLEAPDRSEELLIPVSLEDLATRTATLPTDAWMERLAHAAAARERRQGRAVARVRVEVRVQQFDRHGFGSHEQPLRSRTIAVDERP